MIQRKGYTGVIPCSSAAVFVYGLLIIRTYCMLNKFLPYGVNQGSSLGPKLSVCLFETLLLLWGEGDET